MFAGMTRNKGWNKPIDLSVGEDYRTRVFIAEGAGEAGMLGVQRVSHGISRKNTEETWGCLSLLWRGS